MVAGGIPNHSLQNVLTRSEGLLSNICSNRSLGQFNSVTLSSRLAMSPPLNASRMILADSCPYPFTAVVVALRMKIKPSVNETNNMMVTEARKELGMCMIEHSRESEI